VPRERLLGVLCLGAATLAATWGGNDVLHEAAAVSARGAAVAAHADSLGLGAGGAELPQAPPPESSTTVTTAAPSSTTTAPPSIPAPAPPGEPPAAVAQRALLAQADVPAGFTVTSPAPADGSSPDSPFERCAGPDAASLTAAVGARGRSATYARADVGSVSSLVVVVDQPATAEKVLGQLATPAARSCFEGLINARLARNPKLSQDVNGSVGPAPSPSVGEATLGYRFEVRLPAEDVDANAQPDDPPIRFVADFLLIRKGRALVLVEFDNLRQPWADASLRAVAANLAAHL
jgi:hypothetical protein